MITMGKMATEAKLMTVNEWRIKMGLSPVPWGDAPVSPSPTTEPFSPDANPADQPEGTTQNAVAQDEDDKVGSQTTNG